MILLVDEQQLVLALVDFRARNDLIKALDLTDSTDKNQFFKWLLAFWLGSNLIEKKLLSCDPPYMAHAVAHQFRIYNIYIGYYCFLELDKKISLLSPQSAGYQRLHACRQKLISIYNEQYELLGNHPEQFFGLFQAEIEHIDVLLNLTEKEQRILKETKQNCLGELARAFPQESMSCPGSPTPAVSAVSNDPMPIHKNGILSNLNTAINYFITAASDRFPWFQANLYDKKYKDYHPQKILVSANDNIILDGLYIEKTKSPTKRIVLALVGHFAAEHHYIASSVYQFRELFDCDIIFMNHRNYSFRANKFAESATVLAEDVVAFAKYFKDREIVLYGMCGGAAHILIAAEMLKKENTPCKVIIDRFAYEYNKMFDLKTIARCTDLLKMKYSDFFPSESFLHSGFGANFAAPIFYAGSLLGSGVLSVTGNNVHAADYAKKIAPNDLMILQIKESKHSANKNVLVDAVVHPENDIRLITKTKRHQDKLLLKKLVENCKKISAVIPDDQCQLIFSELSECFSNSIKLIDNEKLTKNINTALSSSALDLHSEKLFDLTTRNQMPITVFLNGFFAKSNRSNKDQLEKLASYSPKGVLEKLNSLYPNAISNNELAQRLECFLSDIAVNQPFLIAISNQAEASKLTSIHSLVGSLLAMPFFNELFAHHSAQQSVSAEVH